MRDQMTALVRTVLPAAYGAVAAWLVNVGVIEPDTSDQVATGLTAATVPVAGGLLYAGARWLESRRWMPRWLVRVLLGSDRAPSYLSRDMQQ